MALRPLIVICGTTGVGKSDLAIELALHLSNTKWKRAKVINADAMQVYEGLDVLTNKVPQSQQRGVEHLLMGFKKPGEQYVVGQWVRDAMREIEELHQRSEVPIVVGGTSYWIQHLLFPNRLASDPDAFDDSTQPAQNDRYSESLERNIAHLPSELLDLFNNLPMQPPSPSEDPNFPQNVHRLLTVLDPLVASRWHWKDVRKVHRSVTIIKEKGVLLSEAIHSQSQIQDTPRYRTLCFWLHATRHILHQRLDNRVDAMLRNGLLEEVEQLLKQAESDEAPDYTLGIYQSIGYREFHSYLASEEKTPESLKYATERMKISTRQYAKRQISWIRNQLLPRLNAANSGGDITRTYLLDASELGDGWVNDVLHPAQEITDAFLDNLPSVDPLSLSPSAMELLTIENKPTDPVEVLQARRKVICDVCTYDTTKPVMIDEKDLPAHRNTRVHRRLLKKRGTG